MTRQRRKEGAECHECGLVGLKGKVIRHWWTSHVHHKDQGFVCRVCRTGFGREDALQAHILTEPHKANAERQDLVEPTFHNPSPRQPVIGPQATADIRLLGSEEAAKYGLLEAKKSSAGNSVVPLAPGGKDPPSAAQGAPNQTADPVPPLPEDQPGPGDAARKPGSVAKIPTRKASPARYSPDEETTDASADSSSSPELGKVQRRKRRRVPAYLSDISSSEDERPWKRARSSPSRRPSRSPSPPSPETRVRHGEDKQPDRPMASNGQLPAIPPSPPSVAQTKSRSRSPPPQETRVVRLLAGPSDSPVASTSQAPARSRSRSADRTTVKAAPGRPSSPGKLPAPSALSAGPASTEPSTSVAPVAPVPSAPPRDAPSGWEELAETWREGLERMSRLLEAQAATPRGWDTLRLDVQALTRSLEDRLVVPQQEVRNELIRVRQATERVQRDTQHLKDVAGVKGAIEAVGEAWLPLFQQFVANQAEANRCTQETNRLLRWCVTIMEADQERRRTERQRADAPSPSSRHRTGEKHGHPTYRK